MTTCEKFSLQHLLSHLRPVHAIEVGTYRGGSLQVLSHFGGHVDSIDIDPGVVHSLVESFPNVTFHTGNSADLIPSILQERASAGHHVSFVLIDGDHSTDGVRRDLNALLSIEPQVEMVVLIHDSFNPDCRRGILTANWKDCPYVHEVEIDFIPGVYHEQAVDTAGTRTMWGGFACALLKPEPRTGELRISQQQQGLLEAVRLQSSHMPAQSTLLQRIKRRVKPLLVGSGQ